MFKTFLKFNLLGSKYNAKNKDLADVKRKFERGGTQTPTYWEKEVRGHGVLQNRYFK